MQYAYHKLEKYPALMASIIEDDEAGIIRFRRGLAPRWRYNAEEVARALNETYEDQQLEGFGVLFQNFGAHAELAWARLIEADAATTDEILECLQQDGIRTGLQDPTVIDRFAAGLHRTRQT